MLVGNNFGSSVFIGVKVMFIRNSLMMRNSVISGVWLLFSSGVIVKFDRMVVMMLMISIGLCLKWFDVYVDSGVVSFMKIIVRYSNFRKFGCEKCSVFMLYDSENIVEI